MTGLWITLLLGLSAVLLLPPSRTPVQLSRIVDPRGSERGPAGNWKPRRSVRRRLTRSRSDQAQQDAPMLIHQLTGLLAAGRTPHQLWADAAALYVDDGRGLTGSMAEQVLPVLDAAAQTTSLGLSPVPVFQAAAQAGAGAAGEGRQEDGNSTVDSLTGLWTELAACVYVSERSGAPLAGVLSRYAAQLEGSLDHQAARETAMAGPQATVRLLTWLPAGGLGLGYLLGADPVGVLLGSPAGWLAGAAGAALSLVGRFWSRALVRQAAGT